MIPYMQKKRKICFIITSFIHYSRSFLILDELKKREDVELSIILGGVVLLERFASQSFDLRKILKKDGFENIHEVHFNVDGDNPIAKAKTVGLGIIEFSTALYQIKPDVLLVRGDRFEVLSAVAAAVNMNIPVAHIEGGDVSGTIDESIRHAITKLSHFHFVTNGDAYKRVVRMGENPENIFNFGSPEIEVVEVMKNKGLELEKLQISHLGSGQEFDHHQDYILVLYHPVTTEIEELSESTQNLLEAIHENGIRTIWFWPNFDAGSEIISHQLRKFNNDVSDHNIHFMRYLPPKEFLTLLAHAKCLVGNSSAGIKECSYLGVPVVNVGNRQKNRLAGENVMHASPEKKEIAQALEQQLEKGRYEPSSIYSGDKTSFEIARALVEFPLYVQKHFHE